jgi:hypothetical protein
MQWSTRLLTYRLIFYLVQVLLPGCPIVKIQANALAIKNKCSHYRQYKHFQRFVPSAQTIPRCTFGILWNKIVICVVIVVVIVFISWYFSRLITFLCKNLPRLNIKLHISSLCMMFWMFCLFRVVMDRPALV